MKIVACIKRVPTTEAQVKVAADQQGLDTAGLSWMTSFYDEIAVEEAIRTKEKHGGDVTVLTLGPAEASKDVREFMARGADAGAILKDEHWHARDARSTAKILCARIQKSGAELVFLGKLATDRDNAAVGPMIATWLGWACVCDVIALEFSGTQGTARRETEQGIETVGFSLPAVITCQKGLNEPRRANLKGIMAVKAKAIPEEGFEDVPNQQQVHKVEPPPARKAGRIVGEGASAVPALIQALRSEAGVI
jgi:electron transfer flavoprotein beta subunit